MRTIPWQTGFIVALALLLQTTQCYNEGRDNNLSPLRYGNGSMPMTSNTGFGIGQDINPATGSMRLSSFSRRDLECPAGYIPCGVGEWCHEPGTECCPDASVSCPIGETCCVTEGGCAKPGQACCAGTTYSCPDGDTCCPGDNKNCAEPGGSCCGDVVCAAGELCCNNQYCAPAGGICCGDIACEVGEMCCNNDHCAPSTAECCGDGYCDAAGECCGDGLGCAKEGFICCKDMKQSCPAGDLCCEDDDGPYCSQSTTCLPTLKFPHVPGVTDELQENTCAGLKEFLKNNKNEFDWNGPGKAAKRLTKKQRLAAGCGGPASGGLACPPGYNCDEFPMASTSQGGKGASIMCVPDWLNGFYGYIWESWRSEQAKTNGFGKGTLFRITVEDCDLDDLTKKKRASNSLVLNSHDNLTIFNGSVFGNYTAGNNVVFLSLTPDAANSGTYTFNYTLDSGDIITSGWITDEDGEPYTNLSSLQVGSSGSTTFQLDDDDDDSGPVYFFGWTNAKDVSMNVTVHAPPPSSTASTSSQETGIATGSSTGSAASAAATKNTAAHIGVGIGMRSGAIGAFVGAIILRWL